jgi:dTDP-glucose 4,6-dehydratase
VLDALTYAGRKENLQDVWDKITFIKGDIRKREDVEKAVKGADIVVNFAAETHVDRSIIEAGSFVLTDVFGTYNLLEACRKFDVKRYVQISTDEVYGHILEGSFKEEDRLNPRNPYAASKASADLLCKAYFETYGLDIVITRSTNNYGPYQHPEKFIAKTIIYALLNRKIPVYGTGKNVRDWLYVEDNCEAIDLVLHKGKKGEIYNIAGKQELKNIEVVKTILRLMNKPESLIEFVKDRPGHDLRYSLDISKIEKLGWKPKTKFEEGIRKTIEWYKQNEWWWEPIIEKEELDFYSKF